MNGITANQTRHGCGYYIWFDGSIYVGYWKNDLSNRRGRMIYADGHIYDGYLKDGQVHEFGEYTHNNGVLFEGYWVMIGNMDSVKRHGWMVINMKATISLEKKMALNRLYGLINLVIFEPFSIIIFTVTIPINSQMAVSFQETGFATRFMETEFTHKFIGKNMKVST